jgi:hypothetical protein
MRSLLKKLFIGTNENGNRLNKLERNPIFPLNFSMHSWITFPSCSWLSSRTQSLVKLPDRVKIEDAESTEERNPPE